MAWTRVFVRRTPRPGALSEPFDNPIERLELLAGDDDAIAAFLDEIDVQSPREREMLTELARTRTLARPERFDADHKRAVAAFESLRRHGFHGSRTTHLGPFPLGPLRPLVRWGIQLTARYIVVAYVKNVAVTLRNLYWMREIESPDDSTELKLLRPARFDATALVEITKTRALGVPTFVIGGLLIPVVATVYRLATGVAFTRWWVAGLVGIAGALIGIAISWVVLRGTAMASRRIRLSVREPLRAVYESVGQCGRPPRDQSRTFAFVAIALTVGAWIVLPTLVAIALAT
ncbi:MAG TPA: hypothetical protein VJ689_12535 [Gaiellaceae bacterium]|nr:hypothetical protein [Gaiellaceae bacterium]